MKKLIPILLCLASAPSLAGFFDNNVYLIFHYQAGEAEWQIRVHRGEEGVDTTSPVFDATTLSTLRTAAEVNLATFRQAAATELPNWWSSVDDDKHEDVRRALLASK